MISNFISSAARMYVKFGCVNAAINVGKLTLDSYQSGRLTLDKADKPEELKSASHEVAVCTVDSIISWPVAAGEAVQRGVAAYKSYK